MKNFERPKEVRKGKLRMVRDYVYEVTDKQRYYTIFKIKNGKKYCVTPKRFKTYIAAEAYISKMKNKSNVGVM